MPSSGDFRPFGFEDRGPFRFGDEAAFAGVSRVHRRPRSALRGAAAHRSATEGCRAAHRANRRLRCPSCSRSRRACRRRADPRDRSLPRTRDRHCRARCVPCSSCSTFEGFALPFDVQPFAEHVSHALAFPLPPTRTRITNPAYFCERARHPVIQQPALGRPLIGTAKALESRKHRPDVLERVVYQFAAFAIVESGNRPLETFTPQSASPRSREMRSATEPAR